MDNSANDMMALENFVLDVLQHDVAEQVPSILRMLNNDGCIGWREFWSHDFMVEEITTSLRQLFAKGLICVFSEDKMSSELIVSDQPDWDGSLELFWFGSTALGKRVWDEWEPPHGV